MEADLQKRKGLTVANPVRFLAALLSLGILIQAVTLVLLAVLIF